MMKNLRASRGKFFIERLIAEGEHDRQDFKYTISDARKIARSLSAFANHRGGRLLIGVKDNGTVAGVRSEEDIYMIETAAQIYCRPEPSVTGNDDHALPMMSMGAKGLISVVSNLAPEPMVQLTHSFLEGDLERARALQIAYTPLTRALFSQVNPVPVKAAMKDAGLDSGILRLPLWEMDQEPLEKLRETVKAANLTL